MKCKITLAVLCSVEWKLLMLPHSELGMRFVRLLVACYMYLIVANTICLVCEVHVHVCNQANITCNFLDYYASVGGAPEAYGSHRVCVCVCVTLFR